MLTLAEPTTKRVEYVGLPSPFQDPAVQAMQVRGQITPKRRAALWQMESRRQMRGFCRWPGVTRRTVGTEDGLTRDYVFGPHEFVVDMDVEDIDRLMRMHEAHPQAFRVLDDIITI